MPTLCQALFWVLGPGGEWREGLVPVLEELRSRGAADQETNGLKHVLEVLGDTGMDVGAGNRREDIGASHEN